MKLTPMLAIIAVNVITVIEAQQCPNDWFTGQVTITTDRIIPAASMLDFPDPNGTFFTVDLMYTAEELEADTRNAIEYFNTRFGLDFSSSEPDENGIRYFQNTTMHGFRVPILQTAWSNHWLPSGSVRTKCYDTTQGGFIVNFVAPQVLYGTYGGVEGRLSSAVSVVWTYYRIDACATSPVLFLLRSHVPAVRTPDGFLVDNNLAYNRVLGHGIEQGLFFSAPATPDGSMIRIVDHHHILIPSEPVP